MAEAVTLSQLGKKLDLHPANIRHHLKQLEDAGFVALETTRITGGFVEKYYRATSNAFLVNLAILPQPSKRGAVIATGSHDLALDLLSESLCRDAATPDFISISLGSINGLVALRQGVGHIAGVHLLDPSSGEYNLPYVRHFFPDRHMKVVTLTHRQQGLISSQGHPHQMRDLQDLIRAGVKFVNRNRGSGTRIWLDQQLEKLGIDNREIHGYDWVVNTHLKVAQAVYEGQADVGLGLLAAARKFALHFTPLFEERFDLVIPGDFFDSPLLKPALATIQTSSFRKKVEGLGGYTTSQAGREILVNS